MKVKYILFIYSITGNFILEQSEQRDVLIREKYIIAYSCSC